MPRASALGRRAGVLVPLFAIASRRSWGIGELPDIVPLGEWLRAGGQRLLQLLPLGEMAPGQHSPYTTLSTMAIDPVFIALGDLEDFAALGGEGALDPPDRTALARVRESRRVEHEAVRVLKTRALRAAFRRFLAVEWRRDTGRADSLRAYGRTEAWWLDDHALFRALRAAHGERSWEGWPPALRRREPHALERARTELAGEVLFGQYLQWVADGQWRAARARLGDIGLMGDLPFSAGTDSADVWAHAASHDLGVSVGAPPDAFAREGQDWGLPAYRWEALHESGFRVLADRARRMASLYDAFRVDHVVGLFRTWGRPRTDERPRFSPEAPAAQAAQGEAILDVLAGAGAAIVAEDLGTIPDFVRASLARLGVPGYRVLRWEREWELPGQPFRDPARYPACSLATSGTHDVAPLGSWWDGAPEAERRALGRLPGLARLPPEAVRRPFSPAVRDAILRMLFAAGSDLLVLPILDVFGWRDRINVPATVDDTNWTYRLPWPGDRLLAELQGGERARALLRWTTESGRAADARGGIP